MPNMDERREVEITLKYPVQLADRKLTQVVMRRPTVRDMLDAKVLTPNYKGLEDDIVLYARLCGLVPEEIKLLDYSDYNNIQEQFFRFRGVSHR